MPLKLWLVYELLQVHDTLLVGKLNLHLYWHCLVINCGNNNSVRDIVNAHSNSIGIHDSA